jgi:hypothetical protein
MIGHLDPTPSRPLISLTPVGFYLRSSNRSQIVSFNCTWLELVAQHLSREKLQLFKLYRSGLARSDINAEQIPFVNESNIACS